MTVTIIRSDNAVSLAKCLGDDIVSALVKGIKTRGTALLAVSGGSTPIAVFDYLSHQDIPWNKVKVTLVDERCVPIDHKDSNAKLVQEHLLKNKAALAQFYGLFEDGPASVDDSVNAGLTLLHHFPYYDAVILGMGEDAHTASIFPDSENRDEALQLDSHQLSLLTNPVTAEHWRITQTRPLLLNTHFLALHIVGEKKWQVLEPILTVPMDQLPVSHFIHQNRAPVSVYYAP